MEVGAFRSDDGGRGWREVGPRYEDTLLSRIRVAPSAPDRIYINGTHADPNTLQLTRFVGVSDDAGESFLEHPLALGEGEIRFRLLEVDPGRPDVLYGVVDPRISYK